VQQKAGDARSLSVVRLLMKGSHEGGTEKVSSLLLDAPTVVSGAAGLVGQNL